jgi:hypothetical protein
MRKSHAIRARAAPGCGLQRAPPADEQLVVVVEPAAAGASK